MSIVHACRNLLKDVLEPHCGNNIFIDYVPHHSSFPVAVVSSSFSPTSYQQGTKPLFSVDVDVAIVTESLKDTLQFVEDAVLDIPNVLLQSTAVDGKTYMCVGFEVEGVDYETNLQDKVFYVVRVSLKLDIERA